VCKDKLFYRFIVSAGILLLITAVAKFVSASGNVRILQFHDPIFGVSFRLVFLAVGLLELIVALICLFGGQMRLQAGLVASLATSFFIYRVALSLSAYHGPCHCLGDLTDALYISPQTADTAMKIILAYLLIGSYGILFHLWWTRKAEGGMQNDEIKPVGSSKIEVGS
jgi:hypothetical protein